VQVDNGRSQFGALLGLQVQVLQQAFARVAVAFLANELEAVAAIAHLYIQSRFNLAQVFVKLATEIC
jgi:hypothetical protein